MPAVYDKSGIHFLYPENWALDEQEGADGEILVTLTSPADGLWMLMIAPGHLDPRALSRTAMQTIKQDYEDFEAEPASETIAGTELVGFDINFYCLDLTNTALVRGFRTRDASCVIVCQAEDRDYASLAPVFRAITTSLLEAERRAAESPSEGLSQE
jgi:hypothetical protein